MSWGAVIGGAASIGGAAIGGALGGGDAFDPLDHIMGTLYGQNWKSSGANPAGGRGIIPMMKKDLRRTGKVFDGLGRSGRLQIRDWTENQLGETAQSMGARGLYNTTLLDSANQNIGAQATRMRTDLNEQLALGKLGAQQAIRNNIYDTMQWPAKAMFPQSQGMNQAAGAAAGGWSNIFTQLIGGVLGNMGSMNLGGGGFGGGGPGSPNPGPGWR